MDDGNYLSLSEAEGGRVDDFHEREAGDRRRETGIEFTGAAISNRGGKMREWKDDWALQNANCGVPTATGDWRQETIIEPAAQRRPIL